jgi:cell division septal protein FtsQ
LKDRRRKRLKKLFGRTLILLFACGILLIAGCGAYRRARDWSIFSIRSVVVRGVAEELVERVREESAIRLGTSMFELDRKLVSRRLKSLDFIRDVRIGRRVSGKVVLDVLEREPFALINGEVVVGKDGIEVKTKALDLDIPGVKCELRDDGRGRRSVNPDLLHQAVLVLSIAGELEVKRIDMSHPEDLVLVLGDGTVIHLGRGGFPEKLAMVSLVIADREENDKKFRRVDARYSQQILVKR